MALWWRLQSHKRGEDKLSLCGSWQEPHQVGIQCVRKSPGSPALPCATHTSVLAAEYLVSLSGSETVLTHRENIHLCSAQEGRLRFRFGLSRGRGIHKQDLSNRAGREKGIEDLAHSGAKGSTDFSLCALLPCGC